jgi:hypothetical protein
MRAVQPTTTTVHGSRGPLSEGRMTPSACGAIRLAADVPPEGSHSARALPVSSLAPGLWTRSGADKKRGLRVGVVSM